MDKREKTKFIKAYNDVVKYPTLQELGIFLGIAERTIRRRAAKLKLDGEDLIDRSAVNNTTSVSTENVIDLQVKVLQQQKQISKLQSQLKVAHTEVGAARELKDLIHDTKNIDLSTRPDWLKTEKRHKSLTGIPVLFLSDIHFDEVVDSAQIGYVNEFNHDIATKRIQHTFNTTTNLLMNYMSNPIYDGIVVALGGDMLSGNIHEELAETNAQPILKSVIDLEELLYHGINDLADTFKKVFVPCVVGNHGRLSPIKRFKNKVFENFEWIIYQNLAKRFAGDKRITFYVPDGPDAQFSIYNKSLLLTHGDQFRGGSGIAGIFSPLMLGAHKKQKVKSAKGQSFDIMMCGHFHQYIHTESLIVNGSIKGYDEYAASFNFPFEPPQQALFVMHPQYGATMRTPILCDEYEDKKKADIKNKIKIEW